MFYPADQIRGSLIGAGSYLKAKVGGRANTSGIGSFRPTNNGMFGRFELESIKESR